MADFCVSYSDLYALQLLFLKLDSESDASESLQKLVPDKTTREAVEWLYRHRDSQEKASTNRQPAESTNVDSLDLQSETAQLYDDTKALKLEGAVLDVKESLAISKLQLELLDKILTLHERSKRHRQISEFVQKMFDIMTPEQKELIEREFEGTYSE